MRCGSLFSPSQIAIAICLTVAAFMIRNPELMQTGMTRSSSEKGSLRTEPVEPDLMMLLASPEVQSMMRADHVDERDLLAELNAISAQLQKNTNSIFMFHKRARRKSSKWLGDSKVSDNRSASLVW